MGKIFQGNIPGQAFGKHEERRALAGYQVELVVRSLYM
jgi:hypothetical protein